MNAWTVIRWSFYLTGALGLGVLVGLPAGVQNAQLQSEDAVALASGIPTVIYSERDYRATAGVAGVGANSYGVVTEFAQWDHRPICQIFEHRYSAGKFTAKLQRSFYDQVVAAGSQHNEIPAVIESSAMKALLEANAEEYLIAKKREVKHPSPLTLIVHAERAQYFGQDVWCFLCLSTADGKNGSARVIVISCAPPYGLIHTQEIGTF